MLLPTGLKEIEFHLPTKSNCSKKIAGVTNGNDKAPILLCVHGWLDNAASFEPLIPYLKDFHVIAIDWTGHGHSSHRSDDAHYHFIDWVYDLVELFEYNQWKKIDIIGHSMGGIISTAFSSAFPEYVKSLTLIDALGFFTLNEEKTTEQLRKGMLSRLSLGNKKSRFHPNIESAVNARTAASDLTSKHAQLIVNRGIIQKPDGFQWRSDHRLRSISPIRLTLAQAKQMIKDITVPVQLLYASKGIDMVSSGLKDFSDLFQSLKTYELEGGHHIHMEQPEQSAKLIIDFV